MTESCAFRPATADDSPALALFADMATRRLMGWFWSSQAAPGQTGWELGEGIIRNNSSHAMHFTQWEVCTDARGAILGGMNHYALTGDTAPAASPVMQPMVELKEIGTGSWYIACAALLAHSRGRGAGRAILDHAEARARTEGYSSLTLMLGSFNTHARAIYDRFGFVEEARRPFLPFPGSDTPGEWVLMRKELRN